MLRLAVFDLDGTLKAARDPYLYLHQRLGTLAEAEAFTGKGLNGEIPYEEWLRLDTGLWQGRLRSELEAHLRAIPYLPGARETVAALKAAGVQVAIISSGLLLHAEMVGQELDIGPVLGNEICFAGDEDPRVDGQVRAHVPYGGKGPVLRRLQEGLGISPACTVAVGDTNSDLQLFQHAAVGIAVNPSSPQVAAAADIIISTPDLRPLLGLLHRHNPELWPQHAGG